MGEALSPGVPRPTPTLPLDHEEPRDMHEQEEPNPSNQERHNRSPRGRHSSGVTDRSQSNTTCATKPSCKEEKVHVSARGSLTLRCVSALRQILLRQGRTRGLRLHRDARNPPAADFFDRLNAVDAALHGLAVAAQRVQTPQVCNVAEALDAKIQLPLFQHDVTA